MYIDILNRILLVIFFLCSLNITRHLYYFIQALSQTTKEVPVKYKLNKTSLLILGISIAYIFSVCFTGVKI